MAINQINDYENTYFTRYASAFLIQIILRLLSKPCMFFYYRNVLLLSYNKKNILVFSLKILTRNLYFFPYMAIFRRINSFSNKFLLAVW